MHINDGFGGSILIVDSKEGEAMSLQFIFGNSGAGKSHYLYEHLIKESIAHPEQNYIILVPEQFTMQTQKEIVMRHPRHGIMNIDVLSFERLAFRVLEEVGEGTRTILDDEGKNFVLRKVAGGKKSDLRVLGRTIRKPGYISEVKSVISELGQYDISADEMSRMMDGVPENSYLYYKLKDIQILYRAFEEYLEGSYITREDVLDLFCRQMGKSRLLKDVVIALDGFTGFTPVQNRTLGELLKICQKVFVTVTIDGREDPFVWEDKLQLFALSKQMVTALVAICREQKVLVEKPIELYERPVYRFREQPALAYLESELFRYGAKPYPHRQNNIRIYLAKNPKAEVDCAAQKIRALVRKRKYRYQDIAVIVTDMNVYADEIEKIFGKYQIPVFMDYKRSVLLNSFVEYVRSVLAMVEKNFSYESVFRFLRTGFTGFEQDEMDLVENYVRALGIRGYKKWQEKWIRRGEGMSEEVLEVVNGFRVRFVEKVDALVFVLKQRYKTVKDITIALYEFLQKEALQEQVKKMEEAFEEAGELALAKEYAQVYKVMMDLFDKFVLLLGEERISLKEYCELLDSGMEEARIGVIPPEMDQVMVGDIERTRLRNVKTLLLLGMNEPFMTPTVSGSGLLSEQDREKLEKREIFLSPRLKEKAFIQKYYLYLHMTKPTEELDISYSRLSQDGKAVRPSYVLNELKRMFTQLSVFDMETYGMEYRELTAKSGMEYVIEGFRSPKIMERATWQELYRWYRNHPSWQKEVLDLQRISMYRKPEDALTQKTAERLYGSMEPSISRMEKFVSCACAHFLTYGLRLKERQEYEFAAVDFGNILHKALEHFAEKVTQGGQTWIQVEEEKQKQYVEESVEESIIDYSNTVLYSSARNAYMIPRMKRMLYRTVWALTRQLQKGCFVPESQEVRFGSGKIDRIDVCETQDEVLVKVIDYKTGTKSFDMAAFYHGLQMQLVVYMNEALKLEQRKHPDKQVIPAGIFYYRLKDPIVEKEIEEEKLEEAILKELKLDGIVNGEEAIVKKLDAEFCGASNVIPVTRTKTGFAKYSKILPEEDFQMMLAYANEKREELKTKMECGDVDAFPYEMNQENGCQYCEYKNICGFDDTIPGYEYQKIPRLSSEEVMEQIRTKMKRRRTEYGNKMDARPTESD